jgi:hypothetical protein
LTAAPPQLQRLFPFFYQNHFVYPFPTFSPEYAGHMKIFAYRRQIVFLRCRLYTILPKEAPFSFTQL